MIKHRGFKGTKREPGADDFLPILIYSVLISKPVNPISDIIFIRKFRRENEINGMIDYYLTAYESVFDFFEKINFKKLKIEENDYNRFIDEKNKEYLIEVLDCEISNERNGKELFEKLDGIFYKDVKSNLKFEDIGFGSLFVADLQDLFKEYKMVLDNYKKMSRVVKGLSKK